MSSEPNNGQKGGGEDERVLKQYQEDALASVEHLQGTFNSLAKLLAHSTSTQDDATRALQQTIGRLQQRMDQHTQTQADLAARLERAEKAGWAAKDKLTELGSQTSSQAKEQSQRITELLDRIDALETMVEQAAATDADPMATFIQRYHAQRRGEPIPETLLPEDEEGKTGHTEEGDSATPTNNDEGAKTSPVEEEEPQGASADADGDSVPTVVHTRARTTQAGSVPRKPAIGLRLNALENSVLQLNENIGVLARKMDKILENQRAGVDGDESLERASSSPRLRPISLTAPLESYDEPGHHRRLSSTQIRQFERSVSDVAGRLEHHADVSRHRFETLNGQVTTLTRQLQRLSQSTDKFQKLSREQLDRKADVASVVEKVGRGEFLAHIKRMEEQAVASSSSAVSRSEYQRQLSELRETIAQDRRSKTDNISKISIALQNMIKDLAEKASKSDVLEATQQLQKLPDVYEEVANLRAFVDSEIQKHADTIERSAVNKASFKRSFNKLLAALTEQLSESGGGRGGVCEVCVVRTSELGGAANNVCLSCLTNVRITSQVAGPGQREMIKTRGGGFALKSPRQVTVRGGGMPVRNAWSAGPRALKYKGVEAGDPTDATPGILTKHVSRVRGSAGYVSPRVRRGGGSVRGTAYEKPASYGRKPSTRRVPLHMGVGKGYNWHRVGTASRNRRGAADTYGNRPSTTGSVARGGLNGRREDSSISASRSSAIAESKSQHDEGDYMEEMHPSVHLDQDYATGGRPRSSELSEEKSQPAREERPVTVHTYSMEPMEDLSYRPVESVNVAAKPGDPLQGPENLMDQHGSVYHNSGRRTHRLRDE